jgi:hypothetical protein
MIRRHVGRSDDSGASLIMALVFMTAVGLVVTALLTYSAGGLRSATFTGQAVQSQAETAAAMQTAINDVRNSVYFNDGTATPCLATGNRRTYPALTAPGIATTVSCAPVATTGGAGGSGVPITAANKPAAAILTLGTSTSEVGLLNTAEVPTRIKGPVYSSSTIQSTSQRGAPACATTWPAAIGTFCNGIFVDGLTLVAEKACTGTIVAIVATRKTCSTNVNAPAGDDPAYVQPITGMTSQTLPTCTASALVTFTPGYYDDAVGLSLLTDGDTGCRNKTFWFSPGVYYFDFHNSEMPASGAPVVPFGTDVWTFNDPGSVLVGGTKNGWTTSTTTTNMPGSCVSPLNSRTATGVQFVFGDDSQFSLQQGGVELCGTWSVDKPPVAFYGAKTLTGDVDTNTFLPAVISSPSTTKYAPLVASQLASVTDADAGPAVTVSANGTSTLRVSDFSANVDPLAKRAVLQSAIVTIRHGERRLVAGGTMQLRLTPNRAGAAVVTKSLSPTFGGTVLAYKTETVDVTADFKTELYAFGMTNALGPFLLDTVLTANGTTQTANSQIDYIKIDFTWRPIAVRPGAGCVVAVAGCSVLRAVNNELPNELYVQGTVYAPFGEVDFGLYVVDGPIVTVGLIARAVILRVTDYAAGATDDDLIVAIPDDTPLVTPLTVYLTAWTCTVGTCAQPPSVAGGWEAAGRTLVQYTDLSSGVITGQRDVAVKSWQVAR